MIRRGPTHTNESKDDLRVLILAPSGRDARLAKETVARSGLTCQVCANLPELSREVATGAGAVLIAEEALPRNDAADPELWLGIEPPWSALPLVVLTGRAGNSYNLAALRRLEERPKVSFLERPVPKRTLISTLRGAIEGRRRQYTVRDLLDERMQLLSEVRDQLSELQTLYDAAPIGLAMLDEQLRFQRINRIFAEINGLPVAEHLGKSAWDILPDLRETAEPLMRKVMETGEPITEIELSGETSAQPGMRRDWLERFYPVKTPDGRVTGLGIIAEEVTTQKRAEERQEMLTAELHHRVKNVLSVVQSTVMQTLRSAVSMEDFGEVLSGRLQALARGQDILLRSESSPTTVPTLLQCALAPFGEGGLVSWSSGDIWLRPEAALALNLIVHELATNATKYGALSVPVGIVQIDCQYSADQAGVAVLRWVERGGPPVKPPLKRGFGTKLIERCAKYELGGEASVAYAPEGFECTIRIAVDDPRESAGGVG